MLPVRPADILSAVFDSFIRLQLGCAHRLKVYVPHSAKSRASSSGRGRFRCVVATVISDQYDVISMFSERWHHNRETPAEERLASFGPSKFRAGNPNRYP
jgi:hypothetical protein